MEGIYKRAEYARATGIQPAKRSSDLNIHSGIMFWGIMIGFVIVAIIIIIAVVRRNANKQNATIENFSFGNNVSVQDASGTLTFSGQGNINLGNNVTIGNWNIQQDADGNLIFQNGTAVPSIILSKQLNQIVMQNVDDICGGGIRPAIQDLNSKYKGDYLELRYYPYTSSQVSLLASSGSEDINQAFNRYNC